MTPHRPARPTALAILGGVIGGAFAGYLLGGLVAVAVIPPAQKFGDGLLEGLAILGAGTLAGAVLGGVMARRTGIWVFLGFLLAVGFLGGLVVGWVVTWLVLVVVGVLGMNHFADRQRMSGPPGGGPLIR